ncbi:MAG: hypothetical protein ACKV2T_08380 [Kofleriaceae bacterium]
MRTTLAASLISALVAIPACATEQVSDGDFEDGENDSIGGKSDSPAEGSSAALAILAVVNDTGVDEAKLDNVVGLSTRVAEAIVKHRDGEDREWGTDDDNPFDTLAELDAIPYVGPITISTISTYARRTASTTTLRIDLVGFDYGDDRGVKLESLNARLASEGISFPKQLVLGQHDGAKFLEVMANLEKANAKLGTTLEVEQTWDPSRYVGLCYSGDVATIGQTIDDLRYSLFSIYMGIQGERIGTRKKVFVGNEREWLRMQLEDNGSEAQVAIWKNYDTSSKTYLMMTDGGQQGDGTEFFAVQIPKCQ